MKLVGFTSLLDSCAEHKAVQEAGYLPLLDARLQVAKRKLDRGLFTGYLSDRERITLFFRGFYVISLVEYLEGKRLFPALCNLLRICTCGAQGSIGICSY